MNSGIAAVQHNYRRARYPSSQYRWKIEPVKFTSDRIAKLKSVDDQLVFIEPLCFGYTIEEGLHCADFNAAGLIIASAESSYEKMIEDMKSQFRHAWVYYAMESDEMLNDSAKKVKRWLLAHLRAL